ncbi:hypothetical protein [Desulfogranum marinum]|uniref:hypothetical protein n=1 Tax=Desulfogranum marinum TaxID=453220 RepID=UPI0029C5FD49|nr:hypothetical protein [Desulfogranum marinum]
MGAKFHQIIDAFVNKHGLSKGQVIAEIEKTFSSMLSRWHRKNVVVVFTDGQLSALGYHEDAAGPLQIQIDLATMRGWNTIKRILDKNLSTAACLDEVGRYKRKEKGIVWGEVISRDENSLGIELDMKFGVSLYATCPLQYLGKHERGRLLIGDRKFFHIRRVESVMFGDIPRTQITVDRVSKTLVVKLIKHQLSPKFHEIKLRCTKRYVGHKSFVESSMYVPRKAITETAEELSEHIQVNVIRERT